MARAIPPYTDLMEWADGQLTLTLNFANFLQLTDDPLYFEAYLQSLQVAGISTLCCLLLGYPLAWAVAHSKPSTRNILLLLVILPSWTSFLIRVYAWMGLLKSNGVLNNFLLWLGVIDQPLEILHTNLAVYIGIVYAYLPFMVLPIYTALTRIDYSLEMCIRDSPYTDPAARRHWLARCVYQPERRDAKICPVAEKHSAG